MKNRIWVMMIFLFVAAGVAFGQNMTVSDSDMNVLMEVEDMGTTGALSVSAVSTDSVEINSMGAAPDKTSNKLYNVSGSLYWSGTALGAAGSAGGWTDDGTAVRLTTITDKVGIGISSPECTLDVKDSLGINGIRVLYHGYPNFNSTLIVGNGGTKLQHTEGVEGWGNTVVGHSAFRDNTTGSGNTVMGHNALMSNTTGYENTIIGDQASDKNTTGQYNTVVGANALRYNTTGNNNTSIGYGTNYYNQTGSNNTIIGYEAGRSTSTHDKSGNVFIGYQAGYNENGDNKLYIENSNSDTPLIGGNFSSDELYFFGNVGIETSSPQNKLDVEGGMVVGSSYSGSETAPADGLLVEGKVGIGDTSPTYPLDVSGRVGINDTQILYLPDQTDYEGTLIIGTGGGSLSQSVPNDGKYNTAVGINAMNAITTGYRNTASGDRALYANSTGARNTAHGCMALYNSTGSYNTACGAQALYDNTTGSYNTAIGYQADVSSGGLTNATAIGYGAEVNDDDKVVIGNGSVSSIGGYADWSNYSDMRYKENIIYQDNLGLDFIMKLNTVSFNYVDDKNKRRRDGLIAQDVEAALQELGIEFSGLIIDEDEQQTMNLSYGQFVLPLINAMKEQQEMISDLKNQVKDVLTIYEKQEAELTELKRLVNQLYEHEGSSDVIMSSMDNEGRE